VAIFILRSFFEDIPRELEEAAQIDGASTLRLYWNIAIPLAMPAIATITIFTALGAWNEFLLALIVFSDQSLMPLQVGLQTFQGTYFSQYALMMAATAITTVPIVLLYFMMQKYIIKGIMAGALKG
jgi:multiple sugar transport system permease protein/raffinose/stachyose/melibiose transport system permease protein